MGVHQQGGAGKAAGLLGAVRRLGVGVAMALGVTGAWAQVYVATPLATVYGYGEAYAINNAGQIAGSSGMHARLWSGNGFTEPSRVSLGYGINNAGQVVGGVFSSQDVRWNAMVWSAGSVTELVTLPGGVESFAYGIGIGGPVVGTTWFDGGSYERATLWSGGGVTDLGTLGGSRSRANAINKNGQVVGWGTRDDGIGHAALWSDSGVTDLGALWGDGSGSDATAINDAGQVVGLSEATGYGHAVLWSGGVVTDLGTLFGGQHSGATGINNVGQVVGWSYVGSSTDIHATVWTGGALIDLNDFIGDAERIDGWFLYKAYGINDSGWIVATALNTITGDTRPYLLVPQSVPSVPEPAAWVLMLAGVSSLQLLRRRQGRSAG